MKVALLISGEFREFNIAHKSWNFLNRNDLDIYWSIWDNSCIRSSNHNITIEPIDTNLIFSTNPKKVIIESSQLSVSSGQINMIHRIKDGIHLILNSGINYDLVLIIRPDLMLSITEMYLHSQLFYAYDNQVCMINTYNKEGGYSGDQLMILPIIFAKKFAEYEFRRYYDTSLKFETIDTHTEFINFFGDSAIGMPDFVDKHIIVRSNARSLSKEDQLDFYKVLKTTAEWWKEKYNTPYCTTIKI